VRSHLSSVDVEGSVILIPMGSFASSTKVPAAASRVVILLKLIESAWIKIARRSFLSFLLIVALCLVLRLAVLPVDPKPEPRFHDEFSYIFGAETLAEGRLATPTHPMWRFFETYHINMQPTYVSKYPPGQSVFLALGIRLFGHPWYGVLISVAVMCGCIYWMLQGWMPSKYALLGGLFAVLVFGVSHYWTDSYWGGAVAGIGGTLVLGTLPRLARHGKTSTACAAAIGIAILANSRPFEGLALVFLTFAALIWWTRGRFATWLRPAVVVPSAIILLSAAGAMAYYNFKTTGSPITLPYSLNQQRYGASPLFWIMPPYAAKHREYRDPSMREFWESWDVDYYARVRRDPLILIFRIYKAFRELLGDGAGLVLIFLFACAIPLAALPRVRVTLGILMFFFCAIALDKFVFPHYMAPAVGAIFIVTMFGVRLLRCHRLKNQPSGLTLVASVVALACVLFTVDNTLAIYGRTQPPDASAATDSVVFRRQVAARLETEPGTHLVLVHYAPNHNHHEEIVYNTPDIDQQKIVWAFDFGPEADRPLLDYYRGRKVWLVIPDGPHPTLEPYSPRATATRSRRRGDRQG
jgi:hypothetical protein